MAVEAKSSVKGNFSRGDRPTSADFTNLVDSAMGSGAWATIGASAATTAAIRAALGISSAAAVGQTVYDAATTASAQSVIGLQTATTAQMSAPTNTSSAYITPGHLHYHPLMPKAWVNFKGTGTVSINQAWNVAAIGDLAQGSWRITFGSAFPTRHYCPLNGPVQNTGLAGKNIFLEQGASAGDFQTTDIKVVAVALSANGAQSAEDVSSICLGFMDR